MKRVVAAALIGAFILAMGAQSADEPATGIEYAEVPPQILTPSEVESRIGKLEFFDGYPSADTVTKVYDHLGLMRGVRALLDSLGPASLHAMREGLREVGCVDATVGIYENRADPRAPFMTLNTESVYAFSWLDLKAGPVALESSGDE